MPPRVDALHESRRRRCVVRGLRSINDYPVLNQPGPLSCVFYQSAVASNAPFAVISDALNDLHIHEVRARGGVAAAASGSSHSVVAVDDSDRAVPVSGGRAAVRRGSARNMCAWHMRCEPGWSGDGCTKQACEPLTIRP